MILSESQFEKLADSISGDFLKNGTELAKGVIKVAHELHLNPDQIRQLTRITNVRTHLELFEKQSVDKIVEFPVADPDAILQEFYGEPPAVSNPDDSTLDFGTPLPEKNASFDKTASWTEVPKYDEYATLTFADSKNRLAVRKIASEMEGKLLEAKEVYKLFVEKMATEVRKFDAAEAPALIADIHSVLGKTAECLLVDVSTRARLAKPVGLVKQAEVVDTSNPIFKLANQALEAYNTCIKLAVANGKLNKKLRENGLI
jgi:hypothetical protein